MLKMHLIILTIIVILKEIIILLRLLEELHLDLDHSLDLKQES